MAKTSALQSNAAVGVPLNPKQQEAVIQLARNVQQRNTGIFNMRSRMEWNDRVYQRETDFTTKQRYYRAALQSGDASKLQNITIPVVMPQVETMLDTLRDIFLSSTPMFPVVSKPDAIDAAQMMEAVIDEQCSQFGWPAEFLGSMRDGLKHNLMACEVVWETKKVFAVENDATRSMKQGAATETTFSGNAVRRIDPYNLIVDERVLPYEQHTKGEFVGYHEMISGVELKKRFSEWDPTVTMNAAEAFNSPGGMSMYSGQASAGGYFIPQINSFALMDISTLQTNGETNWDTYMGISTAADSKIKYHNSYKVTTLYMRIIPSQLGLSGANRNTPQIFKLIVVNDSILVYFQRQSNAHNLLPIVCCQPLEDGTGWQAKSLVNNAEPYQNAATALFNSGMESQRRKVYDRIFYDPSRINKADIDNTSAIARIPIKTEGYGKPIAEAFAAVPYRDDQVAAIFAASDRVVEMANIANGQNRVQQGQFQKGNKTRTEFQETMANSDSRPRMTALVLEYRFFNAVKTIIKMNVLQYQQADTYTSRKTAQAVKIDPVALRNQSLEFKIADGLIPSSEYINEETFQALFNMAGQNPMVMQSYDIMGIFAYWMKLKGANWIDDFKIQQQPAAPMGVPGAAQIPGQPGATPPLQ